MLRSLVLLGAAAFAVAQQSSAVSTSVYASSSSSASASTTSYAQTESTAAPPAASTPSSTVSQPVTHTVGVGKGGHTMEPDVTLAEIGDIIEFDFYPTNHSVIRAEYGYPCIPYEDTGVNKFGFFSGFRPVDAILPDPPKFSVRVNDTLPIFFYCGAPGSCIGYQMVGVINPNATTSLVEQKQLAGASTFVLLPGQPWPSEDQNPFSSTAGASTSTVAPTNTNTAAPAATSSDAATSSSHHSGLTSGAIAGIVIGAAAVALAAAVLLYLCGRNSRRQNQQPTQQQVPFVPPPGNMSYIDPNKHMSMHSSFVSQALPGYAPHHDPAMSPGLQPTYAASDALNPGTVDGHNPGSPSPSPSQMYAAPAYSNTHPHHNSMQSTPHQSGMYAPLPHGATPHNVHEMAAPEQPGQQGGIMNFIRKSSVSKSGGVERYG